MTSPARLYVLSVILIERDFADMVQLPNLKQHSNMTPKVVELVVVDKWIDT